MKIRVRYKKLRLTLLLPTNLLFGQGMLWLAERTFRQELENPLPPQALPALFAEVRRVKKKYGTWELVELESSDGEFIQFWL